METQREIEVIIRFIYSCYDILIMAKEPQTDVPSNSQVVVVRESLPSFIMRKIKGDTLPAAGASTSSFPWTYPQIGAQPIGTMFVDTSGITDSMLANMYQRYQLARVIVDKPIEESFYNGFTLKTDPSMPEEQAQALLNAAYWAFEENKFKIMRVAKLVRLFGMSQLVFGWQDKDWSVPLPKAVDEKGAVVGFNYVQPVPKPNIVELKVTETMPIEVQWLSVVFGSNTISQIHPTRFIHAYNPKLSEEDKLGESCLLPIYNLLEVQIHADWSTGQGLWRNATGLQALGGPKRNVTDVEVGAALQAVENQNAKTVVYIPFGWTLKNILRGSNLAVARTYKVIVEQIAAGSGIPYSILVGSQRGSISPADQDFITYYRMVGTIQQNLLTPLIQRYFRMCQMAGIIPPGPIQIDWNKLEFMSPADKANAEAEVLVLNALTEQVKSGIMTGEQLTKTYAILKKER